MSSIDARAEKNMQMSQLQFTSWNHMSQKDGLACSRKNGVGACVFYLTGDWVILDSTI